MTEEKLAPNGQTASKRRIIGLVLAVLAIFVAALWLLRQPIAEAIARSVCEGQKLSCQLSITRLDFGGVTLTGLDARAPNASNAALAARELSVDLAWDNPFSPRARAIAGDDLIVRLDLTGRRSPLGDLETAITNFTKPTDKPPPTPQLSFTKITVIGDTLSGPVQALGTVKATGPDAFVIDLAASPATLGLSGATVQLAGGQLKATVAGQQITGVLKLDLVRFEATDMRIADVKIDAALEQVTGVLKGSGTASLGAVTVKDTSFTAAQAKASIVAAPINTSGFSLNALLAGVRKLQLDAATGEGSVAGTTWRAASLTASIQPTAANRSGGDFLLAADDIKFPQGAAGRIEVAGKANIAEGVAGNASGTVNVRSAIVLTQSRKELVEAVAMPLEAVLPVFGDAVAAAVNRAAQNFDATASWTASASKDAFDFVLLAGGQLKAASGLTLSLAAPAGRLEVISLTTAGRGSWTGAGSLQLTGGGAPPFMLDVARATGGEGKVSIAGAATLRPWKVGSDSVSAEFTGGEFDLDGRVGKATGQLTVKLDGSLGGGVWKGARGAGRVDAVWDDKTFAADAPQGVVIQWNEARYGETRFGAAALRYTPLGRLAELQGEGLVGRGVLADVAIPVDGGGAWTAKAVLGAAGINWRAAGGFRATFNMAPSTVDVALDQRKVPIRVADISGELDLRDGWRVTGDFSGGSARADEATFADLAGKFTVGGKGDALDGSLSNVSVRVFDPNKEEDRRYEEAKFEGGATLRNSIVDFTGQVAMSKSGVQIAHITGSHSLKDNAGSLTYDPTPLIFARGAFQPYDLSPLLRGPANVTGRVDISGAASWTDKVFKASATAELKKLGFALASAGVFEGVSGKVEIGDLLSMKSAPGQQITIDKVTLGLPIEKGTIRFQLIGFDAIGLEGAEWPFGGGFIRVKPAKFGFAAGESNRVVAQAVNWDLERLVTQFKVPDLKLKGVVSGDFPVMFSTGSAVIDKAVLKANKDGGVIQYSGSAGDAAAQADENSKRLFDALKDFRYDVLEAGLDGDVTGRIMLTLKVYGKNPEVLAGTPFQLNIGIDSELIQLLQNAAGMVDARAVISQSTVTRP